MTEDQIKLLQQAEMQLEISETLDGVEKIMRVAYAKGIIHGMLFSENIKRDNSRKTSERRK